jgi:hypothetical protein
MLHDESSRSCHGEPELELLVELSLQLQFVELPEQDQ